MKSISIRILIIILLSGIVTIAGVLTLSFELERMATMHEEIMEDNVRNRQMMAEIGMFLDRHHAMVNNCVISNEEESFSSYKEQEAELRQKEKDLILAFSERMKGGTREKLFHKVYSGYCAYLGNVDTILAFSGDDMVVASYYNDNILSDFLDQIHNNIQLLDDMMITEIDLAQEQMNRFIDFTRMLRLVCLVVSVAVFLICAMYCGRLSYSMDTYKTMLEKELTEKNRVLQEHNEHLLKLQNSVIMGISTVIESRDLETGEHVRRTSDYVDMLAREARDQGLYREILTDEFIERLVSAAPLHDIGKITVPDRILLKPGRFTPEEFDEMKKHAGSGREIVSSLFGEIDDPDYVRIMKEVTGGHHEKWNGEGYPDHLSGDEIPVASRIMAIADVFDALISKRHYKEAYPVENAFRIIEESAGTHFDPRLAHVFLSLRDRIEAYLKENEPETD